MQIRPNPLVPGDQPPAPAPRAPSDPSMMLDAAGAGSPDWDPFMESYDIVSSDGQLKGRLQMALTGLESGGPGQSAGMPSTSPTPPDSY